MLAVVAVGDTLSMTGVTVNATALLATPTVTTALAALLPGNEIVPVGTWATMVLALQLVGDAATPLNVNLLVPCVSPKLDPLTVTDVPNTPELGEMVSIVGTPNTVKGTALLGPSPTATTTGPLMAVGGTGTTMLLALQLLGVAVTPLKVTVLSASAVPKFVPAIVTDVPAVADAGVMPAILGEGSTVKSIPLLEPANTGPLVAPAGTKVYRRLLSPPL